MKKTTRTKKLDLDRTKLRELSTTELQQPAGGMGQVPTHVTCSQDTACCTN